MIYIRRILIFVLICDLLESIIVNTNYRKYLKLVAGIVAITLIISPINSFVKGKTYENKFIKEIMDMEIISENYSLKNISKETRLKEIRISESRISKYIIEILSENGIKIERAEVHIDTDDNKYFINSILVYITSSKSSNQEKCSENILTEKYYVKQILSKKLNIDPEIIHCY